MKLVKFVDYRVQELRQYQQDLKTYVPIIDAETQALGIVLSIYRWALKWAMVPVVVIDFLLVRIGVKSAPKPVFEQRLEKDRDSKLAKLGMKDKK